MSNRRTDSNGRDIPFLVSHDRATNAAIGSLTGITREDIEQDASRRALAAKGDEAGLWTDAQLRDSLDATLRNWNGEDDVYVFGYGSLVWNPCMQHHGRIAGTVRGFHRRFCMWSHIYRGTAELPGLVLALDRGGAVRGMLYRLAAERARHELELLWRREMIGGSYVPKWLRAQTEDGEVPAIGFVINHRSDQYAGKLSDERVVEILAHARGRYGTGADYLVQTAEALRAAGLGDAYLDHLCRLLSANRFSA